MNPDKLEALSSTDRKMMGLETEANKEKINPADRVVDIAMTAVQTPEEQTYAQKILQRMEQVKTQLKSEILKRNLGNKRGEELAIGLMGGIDRAARGGSSGALSYHRNPDGETFTFRYQLPLTERGDGSKDYNERLFKALGALSPEQNLDSLRALPQSDPEGGPVLLGGDVSRLKTVIPNTELGMSLGDKPESYLYVPLEQLDNIVDTIQF